MIFVILYHMKVIISFSYNDILKRIKIKDMFSFTKVSFEIVKEYNPGVKP